MLMEPDEPRYSLKKGGHYRCRFAADAIQGESGRIFLQIEGEGTLSDASATYTLTPLIEAQVCLKPLSVSSSYVKTSVAPRALSSNFKSSMSGLSMGVRIRIGNTRSWDIPIPDKVEGLVLIGSRNLDDASPNLRTIPISSHVHF